MKLLDRLLGNEFFFKKKELSLLEEFVSFLFSRNIKKGECILKEGVVNNKIFYIQSGFLRVYVNEDGKEINTWFVKEGDFIMSVNSFHKEIPSKEYIEALEDSVVLSITKDIWYMLMRNNNKLALFSINELFANLCEYQNQCQFLRYMTAEERYAYLVEQKPDIIERISQKHLASFLGIDITYLSKILKKNNQLTG